VVCERIARAEDDPHAVTNPSIIVEVLSDSSEVDDRGDKWAHYRRLPSLRHYVLVSQTEKRVDLYTRERRGWHYEDVSEGSAELSALQINLDIDELYALLLIDNA